MRRALLYCAAIALAIACGDSITEPLPDRTPATTGVSVSTPVAFATTTTEDGLSISTDKDDYQPGDTVHFTGAGWPANDVLDIVLVDEPQTHDPRLWSVNVGEDGTFQDSTYVVDEGDLNVTFTLTATSRATGRSLTVQFTDGNLQQVNLVPASRSVAQTGSAVYTVNVTIGGNANNCTVTLSVTTALPTGAVASFNNNPFESGNATVTRTLTITTSATPAGTYPFTVQAAEAAAGQGISTDCQSPGGTATIAGTLIVFGPATKLAFGQQPTNAQSTSSITPAVTVQVLDAGNRLVANSTASISLAIGNNPGGGTLSGTATQNAVAGVATFPGLSINKIGTGYTLTASSGILTGATSNAFNITLGPATQLAFTTQPGGGAPGSPISPQPVVTVQDAGGNTITSGTGSTAPITLAILAGTGTPGAVLTCTPSNTKTASGGVASFVGCSINLAGTNYQLRATTTTSGIAAVNSNAFNIVANNQAPTVDAGTYTVAEGTELTLNPTVNDPDAGDILTYAWTVNTTGIDASGACTFVDASQKNAKLTCTDDSQGAPGGKFTLTLEVNDGNGHVVTDNADLTLTNADPTANAKGPYTGNEGTAIPLDGAGEDPGNNDDANLTYKWTVNTTGIDAGGTCTFDDDTKKDAEITCTDDSNGGHFVLSLVVKDDDGGTSAASTANLTVNNVKPVADAGGGASGYSDEEGTAIQLSGSGNDPGDNDDPHLTYQWTVNTAGIDAGGTCTFDDATDKNAKVTCTDDSDDATGDHFILTLVVSDDDGLSSTGSVANLTVTNAGPVANAGPDYTGSEGSPVQLEGSVTDAGSNDTHTWYWKYVAGAGVDAGATCSFSPSAAAEDPTITCTDDGTIELTLKVKDDDGAESSDVAMLTLANVDPVADAGGGASASYSGNEGSPVQLYGSATDAGSNDTFTWSWAYEGVVVDPGATCSFSDPTAKQPTVTCTDDGTVKLTLTVTDDDGGDDTDEATLTLANVAPVAAAGGPYLGSEGSAISLTGSKTDAGTNDTHTYLWTYAAVSGVDVGATCSFSSTTVLNPTINCTDDGVFKVTLKVTDDDNDFDTDEAALTLSNANPVANAGGPYSGNEGTAVPLTGTESDPGTNDQLTHSWSYTAGAGVDAGASCSFTPNNTALSPSIKCTDDGTFQLTLTVNDDDGGSATSTASLTLSNVPPVISSFTQADGSNSALPATIIIGGTLNLRAAFTDLGTNDTHKGQVDCGTGIYASETSTTSPYEPSCTFTSIGLKVIKVKVSDDDYGSAEVTHTLTVVYNFSGFFAPVDRPNTMNLSKAGQAIPLKWRLTDANGQGITDLVGVTVKAVSLACSNGTTVDQIEEYAAGSSGLQNLGDGNYQFNWKTPTSYANSCKSIALVFGAGALSYTEGPHAWFTFKK